MRTRRRPSGVDSLFPRQNGDHGRLEGIAFSDLPYISRPIVENIHETRPDIMIAGDRGGRLFAFSVFQSWKRRFPGEPFPTKDGKIHFARVSSRSASEQKVKRAVHFTLERAGLPPDWKQQAANTDGGAPKVTYLDDWAVYGDTIRVFREALAEYGLPDSSLTFATMCGNEVGDIKHIVGDPSRDPRRADWNDKSYYSGVDFPYEDNVTPEVMRTDEALFARAKIIKSLDAYYDRFRAAVEAGRVATCACWDGDARL